MKIPNCDIPQRIFDLLGSEPAKRCDLVNGHDRLVSKMRNYDLWLTFRCEQTPDKSEIVMVFATKEEAGSYNENTSLMCVCTHSFKQSGIERDESGFSVHLCSPRQWVAYYPGLKVLPGLIKFQQTFVELAT